MPATDDDIRLHIYERFVEDGRPPSVVETAEVLGVAAGHVEAAYGRLAERRVVVLHPNSVDIWMANPLSAVSTSFRVEVDGRVYFGNCAWDALGVPPMLGLDGTVRTECPDCREALTLRVEDGSLRPVEAVAHFAVPAARWWDDIGYT